MPGLGFFKRSKTADSRPDQEELRKNDKGDKNAKGKRRSSSPDIVSTIQKSLEGSQDEPDSPLVLDVVPKIEAIRLKASTFR